MPLILESPSKRDHSLERPFISTLLSDLLALHIHIAGAFAGRGPPVANVSKAPVASGMSSSAYVRETALGVSQMKMAPSVPAVTMYFWLGEMAIFVTSPEWPIPL